MKRVLAYAVALALVALGFGVPSSQASTQLIRPNFSGRWTLVAVPTGSHPPTIGSATLGYAFDVNQDEKALILVTGNDPAAVKTVYPLDGSVTRVAHAASAGLLVPLQFEVQAHWDNGRLFLRSTMLRSDGLPAGSSAVLQVWSYDRSGQLVVETSSSGGPLPPRASMATYRRSR
jgi:hypothetical protein